VSIKVIIDYGDTAQLYTDTLTIGCTPIDLSGCSVQLVFKKASATVERVATIVSAANGTVSYQPVLADVIENALLKWKITYSDGKLLHVPTGEWIALEVTPP
jgi:hypothetical protein